MAWQDVFPVSSPRIDADEEREQRLAMQARAGAEWALTALIARYQPPVTRYLTRLTGNPERARILAERIFVRMERRIQGPQGGRYLRLWLLRSSTEDGLDALRRPRRSAPPPRLSAPRPLALLNAPGVAPHIERLRAGIGAIAGVTGQTSRQVRKLIWPDRAQDAAKPIHGLDMPQDEDIEEDIGDTGEPDAREALRYRMVRAILAELPYADAQCVALHLVAGLNQAEVARSLGLTNSATRRRIVQGLQMFSQRYNAAVATLGLSPDMLDAIRPDSDLDPLAPGVGGYVPYQEQPTDTYPTVTVSPEAPLPEPDLLEAAGAATTNWLPREDATGHTRASFSVSTDSLMEGTIVEAIPSVPEMTEARPLILAEAMLIAPGTTPLPPQDEVSDETSDGQPNGQPAAFSDAWTPPVEALQEQEDEQPTESVTYSQFGDNKPTLPRITAVRPARRDAAESAPPSLPLPPPAPVVPVLSPTRFREPAETVPLRGRERALADLADFKQLDTPLHLE